MNTTKRPAKVNRELHSALLDRGWNFARRAGSGHMIYRHPGVGTPLVVSSTPSDHRDRANTLALAARLAR